MLKTLAAVLIAASMLTAPALAESTTPAPSATGNAGDQGAGRQGQEAPQGEEARPRPRACEVRASRPPWPPSRAACVEADACGAHDP